MQTILEKLKEVVVSVLPITGLVVLLGLTVTPLGSLLIIRFLVGAFFIVMGLTIFLIGVDHGITPLGNRVGETMTKRNQIGFFIVTALILGFLISLAEPGLIIFTQQVEMVTSGTISGFLLLVVVSIGIAMLLAVGLFRIVFNVSLYKILMVLYLIIFGLSLFADPAILVIAFDASGATTGVLAVPFILALAYGVSHLKSDSQAGERDSFGTIAIVSAGAIIAVMIMSLFRANMEFAPYIDVREPVEGTFFAPFVQMFSGVLRDSLLVITPLMLTFFVFQCFFFKMKTQYFLRILMGFVYSFIGLMLFLLGVNAGFMDVGNLIGSELALFENKMYIVLIGFFLGVLTILAEPAVYVLTHQIEDVTSGYVTRVAVLIALSIGVGIAIAMALLRVFIEPLRIWHYLLPGYIIAIFLMYRTPKIFVGMAFDAGGVATGPMTATFILAFVQGAALASPDADIIQDGFGMIAMVALMPIITLQLLGLIFKYKSKKEESADG